VLNRNYKESFWAFDDNGILLEDRLAPWSKGDSIGRNAFAYIFWPNDPLLKNTLLSCVKTRDDGYVQFYRYPNEGADTMSRDHVSAIILALYINRDREELIYILDNLPLQLSRRYWQTADFWLWQKALRADLKEKKISYWIFKRLFLLLNLLMFVVVVPWNFFMRKILGVKRYDVSEIPTREFKLWTGARRWMYQKLLYPHFALYNLAWMVRTLKAENGLLSLLLKIEAQNFVIKAVLGRKINQKEYDSYMPTNGFQWAGVFDNGVDRVPRLLTEEEVKYNDIMKGNLDYLYYGMDKIMLNYHDNVVNAIKENKNLINY
jgi:hypothetical protein